MKKVRLMTGGTGTPRYMAPEVAKMQKSYGLPADVYSFSILLWQIVTIRTPFGHISCPTEFASRVVKGGLRPNLACVESASIRNFLENGWSVDPAARHTFSHIRGMLENYLGENRQTMSKQRSWTSSLKRSGDARQRRNISKGFFESVRSRQSARNVRVVSNDVIDVGFFCKPEKQCGSSSRDDPVNSSTVQQRRRRFMNAETCASSSCNLDQEREGGCSLDSLTFDKVFALWGTASRGVLNNDVYK